MTDFKPQNPERCEQLVPVNQCGPVLAHHGQGSFLGRKHYKDEDSHNIMIKVQKSSERCNKL